MTVTSGEAAAMEQPASAETSRFRRTSLDLLAVIGPTSILTGMLYYFGYASAKAFYSYFGVSLSALNLSTANYLIGNADTFFKPMATLLISLIILFIAHRLLGHVLNLGGKGWARGVALGLFGLAVGLAEVGLSGLYGQPIGLVSPLALAAAGLLLEYSAWIACRYAAPPPRINASLRAGVHLRRGLIAALVLLATFWAVTDVANDHGIATARLVEQSLVLEPQAVVYSQQDLHLPGPGVNVTILGGPDSAYRFRYNGLRPLIYADDRWFLLPVGWTHDNGSTVIVLQDDPGRLRVDLAP
jgi:hypothetical protein